MSESRFAYDTKVMMPNQICFVISSGDLYLLGVLNSTVVWDEIRSTVRCYGVIL
jgi:hypothetical protein